jgi:hypothetical protein
MRKMELGEHLYTFFHSQLLEKEAAMDFWALAWQKNKFCTDMLGLLSSKTTINLC